MIRFRLQSAVYEQLAACKDTSICAVICETKLSYYGAGGGCSTWAGTGTLDAEGLSPPCCSGRNDKKRALASRNVDRADYRRAARRGDDRVRLVQDRREEVPSSSVRSETRSIAACCPRAISSAPFARATPPKVGQIAPEAAADLCVFLP